MILVKRLEHIQSTTKHNVPSCFINAAVDKEEPPSYHTCMALKGQREVYDLTLYIYIHNGVKANYILSFILKYNDTIHVI